LPDPVITSVSPQDPSDVVGQFAVADAPAIRSAAHRCRAAQTEWWESGAAARSSALTAAAAELDSRAHDVTALICREVGKPVTEAAGEVGRSVAILRFYAQSCFDAVGSQLPPSSTGLLYTERRPHGVAGLITPWNFPLAIPLWKAAPALAAGNGVLLKPSPDATACAALLVELLGHHLPDGLVSLVAGEADAGEAVVGLADAVSFTGSALVGRQVAVDAAARGIPVQCEMGGQNAAIVLPDADPAATAAMVAGAAMGYAGQKCTATRRIITVGENAAFLDALIDAVESLATGDPGEPATVVGPVITRRARDQVTEAVDEVRRDGGRILTGGRALSGAGWFVEATVADRLEPTHRLAGEETFGPLALVQPASTLEEAVALANGVRYGLVTSVHGADLDAVMRAVARLDTGLIKVNAPTTGVDFYAPFGGEKDSSYGPREQGTAALDFYGTTRTVTIAHHRP
jgi:aldehyde dehydrogenase (NAD+)